MPSKINFNKLISKTKSMKSKNSNNKKNKLSLKKNQKGGVGFTPAVFTGEKVGGQSVIKATSDCPTGVGPFDKNFGEKLYGGKRKNKNKKKTNKNKKNKSSNSNKKNKKSKIYKELIYQ